MRKLGIIFMCVFLNSCCVTGDDVEVTEKLGYYQNMSGMALVYGSALFERERNPGERLGLASDISYMMFTYWAETRIGQLAPSKKVDGMAQKIYEVTFAKQKRKEVARVFEDPLHWLRSETPKMSRPKAIHAVSKSEYRELLDRYHDFLGISKRPKVD